MPNVIRSGIFKSSAIELPDEIPGGIKAVCGYCHAELESIKGDKGEFGKFKKTVNSRESIFVLGWLIKCPECGKKVSFIYPNLTDEIIQLVNNWNFGGSDE